MIKLINYFTQKMVYITIAAILFAGTIVQGQDTLANGQLALEFFEIANTTNQLTQTTVSINYRLSRSTNPSQILDSSVGVFHLHNGMMWGEVAGIGLLKNNRYTLTVSSEDSTIMIAANTDGADAFQISIFDSLFRAMNISGINKVNLSEGVSKLSVTFLPDSYYKNYEIVYSGGLINSIKIETLDTDYDDNGVLPPPGTRKVLNITYGMYYYEQSFDLSLFDEGRFVYKNEYGNWIGTNAYKNWQIIVAQPGL